MPKPLRKGGRNRAYRAHGRECHFCGTTDNLEIHHINGDASDHDTDNLLPVCRDCHMNIHYPDSPEFQEWNDKILSREDRQTGDEVVTVTVGAYDEELRCGECDYTMQATSAPEDCPECGAHHSLELSL